MANMSNVLGLIFANMHELTLTDLTKNRAMASVPFGARYRLIDFPLSKYGKLGYFRCRYRNKVQLSVSP